MPEFFAPKPVDTDENEVVFPPVSRDHIRYCSYDYWFPKYRKVCMRSRIIRLPPAFVEYLREDSIVLSDETNGVENKDDENDDDDDWEPTNPDMKHFLSADELQYKAMAEAEAEAAGDDSDAESDSSDDTNPEATVRVPPNKRFPDVHGRIRSTIRELGGIVAPKLNWSAPKDATYLLEHKNTMKCFTPDDVYLLLKGSSFVSHDLEHAFDGCEPAGAATDIGSTIPSFSSFPSASSSSTSSTLPPLDPVLVLRQYHPIHTALEFRCFVKHRNLVAITPRDLKYYAYMRALRPTIIARAQALFRSHLQFTFPSGSFVFDIYVPEKTGYTVDGLGHGDDDNDDDDIENCLSWARLIDINPWAPRTDTLLFSWRELLDLEIPKPFLGVVGGLDNGDEDEVDSSASGDSEDGQDQSEEDETASDSEDQEEEEEEDYVPELRLVEEDDPAAENFGGAPYSAHKLPKEVVDASMAGDGGMREFLQQWQQVLARRARVESSR